MGGSVSSVTTSLICGTSLCSAVGQCRRHVRMHGVRTSVGKTETTCTCKTFRNAESHRMDQKVLPVELWGPGGRDDCKVKFDVADVAYPVLTLAMMMESAFTFIFDDYKCYMHKNNQRVEIFRKSRIFVLTHHHNDHEKYDQVHYDHEQKLCANTIRCPYQRFEVCVTSKGKSDHYPQPMDGDVFVKKAVHDGQHNSRNSLMLKNTQWV